MTQKTRLFLKTTICSIEPRLRWKYSFESMAYKSEKWFWRFSCHHIKFHFLKNNFRESCKIKYFFPKIESFQKILRNFLWKEFFNFFLVLNSFINIFRFLKKKCSAELGRTQRSSKEVSGARRNSVELDRARRRLAAVASSPPPRLNV